ncbi:hypothetical protein BCR42DRAFT_410159 [Absidia repens]|uniref:Homeodomain-like protein n=1 Tax=Absidia repens TaxID=90262 RepID=A0A1X2INQ3_9FUNG|nr:hypothetical protein BCR42DRAFT_410159 [Absidia repens]
MFEHLYGYGQPQQQPQQQQQTDQAKQLQPYDDCSYDYDNSLNDVPSTSTLPALAFLSQHSGLSSQLHLQEPQHFNGFSHDTTTDSNNDTTTNSTNRRSSSMDDHTSAFSQFNTFQPLDHHDITDATFSIPQLYHHPVDISNIVHSPVVAVPDLPMTLPPLHSSTAPQQSSTTSNNLPASKKQRLARGFRERASWTPEEDNLLRLAVQLYGDKTEKWAKIAACVQGRTNKNCRKRWFHSLDPSLRKGAWTDEEDRLLREGVKKFPNQWSKIADMLEGRTDDQCAKRWRESLDPSIDRSDWTADEDARLTTKFEEFGSQWQKIAQFFDGRPGLHCRNRWRKLQRIAQIKKEKERTSLYLPSSSGANTTTATTATTTTTTNTINDGTSCYTTSKKAKRKGSSLSGHTGTTSFINMGPNESITTRFHHHQQSTVPSSSSITASSSINTNNINAAPTASISALISSTSSPSSSPSLSSPSSSSSSSSSLSSSSPSPSSGAPSTTGSILSANSNSSLYLLLQPQTFHTTTRPLNTALSLPSPSIISNTTTTFNAMNDRRQQDYEAPEPLGHLNPYGCDVFGCFESFSQSNGLFYHMKNVHPDLTNVAKPYRCAVANCSKKYKNINGLQYHLRDAKGISSHTLVSTSSPSHLKTGNKINHGEMILPTLFNSNSNNNSNSNSSNNNNNNNSNNSNNNNNNSFMEKDMGSSLTRADSESIAPAPGPQLHSLSLDNINSNSNSNTEIVHDRPFSCPMIGCKDSFGTIIDLRLHQDHTHGNPFQIAAISALTNPLVESCLLSPAATSTTTTQSLAAPTMTASSTLTTLSPQEQQQQQQPQQQQSFRIRREKWIMESV